MRHYRIREDLLDNGIKLFYPEYRDDDVEESATKTLGWLRFIDDTAAVNRDLVTTDIHTAHKRIAKDIEERKTACHKNIVETKYHYI